MFSFLAGAFSQDLHRLLGFEKDGPPMTHQELRVRDFATFVPNLSTDMHS